MPTQTLPSILSQKTQEILGRLSEANEAFRRRYPGDPTARQPVHTLYGGAHLFKAGLPARMGELALAALEEYAPAPADLARALGLPSSPAWLAKTVRQRVAEKLKREAVEDFRIDFEDGFGNRPDAEEDAAARAAAEETAAALKGGVLPPFFGIRVKQFSDELKNRSARTLTLYLETLLDRSGGRLPANFVVTLPKVTVAQQVSALADIFDAFEAARGLKADSLKMEIMVETTQSVLGPDGRCPLPDLIKAARGRLTGAHFGTYDYTASCSVTAQHQTMDHPVCDFAKHVMKVAFAGTGVWLSDGATNILPVPPHRPAPGKGLTAKQKAENKKVVHAAWRLGYGHIRHSLRHGYYQGWDLHPAQLPVRYAACYSFFLEGLEESTARLKNFLGQAAQATRVGEVFDDAATGQGLLNYFLRAYSCGALTEKEIQAAGLTLAELQTRSFLKIMEGRRAKRDGN